MYYPALALSPDGRSLGGVGRPIRVWRLGRLGESAAASATPVLEARDFAETCAFSPDGRTFVTQGSDRPLRRWNTADWSELPGGWGGSREHHRGAQFPTGCVAYHPRGTLLASSYGVLGRRGFDSVIYLRDADDGKLSGTLTAEFASAHPTAIAFSPSGDHLAGVFGPYLRAWHVPSQKAVAARKVGTKHFKGLAFTPDGRGLVTVSNDEHVRLWDTASWSEVGGFEWQVGQLRSVAVAPDGMRMAAGSATGKVVIWDVD
jgi:WD40 repeat protein